MAADEPDAQASAATSAVDVIVLLSTRALARPLTYLAPAGTEVGDVVSVTVRGRQARGVVVAESSPPVMGRELERATVTPERIPPDLVRLALRLADRYGTTAARALGLVLAPRGSVRRARWLAIAPGVEPAGIRGTRRRALVELLERGSLPLEEARSRSGASAAIVRALLADGTLSESGAQTSAGGRALPATPAQELAIARLVAEIDAGAERGQARPLLLFGVTGSGKTEVFLRGIEHCLAVGRSAIVLVPEIALTPQTATRVTERFPGLVAVLHSGQAAGLRATEHARIASGEARVVVGPRSAIFAPVSSLGLIVIDEEHEQAYKQDSDPRYDARSVALLRAGDHGAAVLFASATPRPESWSAMPRVVLPERIGGLLPRIRVIDLRLDSRYPLTAPLADALGAIERDGGRGMLLLNRRGAAPALHCRHCGHRFRCDRCDVALTLHARPDRLECHHCGRRERAPDACPICGAVDIARLGAGTERLETLVAERFPRLAVIRLDADVSAHAGGLEEALERFAREDRAVLVGTQMIAKGHHFADVRLAAVIDADAGLALPDFRAEERTFDLLVQLAGRAGREGLGATVLLQAWDPAARVVELAATHDVEGFLDGELRRRKLLGYPPYRRLVRVLASAPRGTDPGPVLRELAEELTAAAGEPLDVLGPAELFRIRDRERAHLLVKCERPAAVGKFLGLAIGRRARSLSTAGIALAVDVDPQTL